MTSQLKLFKGFFCKIKWSNYLLNSSNIAKGSSNSGRRNFCRCSTLFIYQGQGTPGSYTSGPEIEDILKYIWNNPKTAFKNLRKEWQDEWKLFGKELKYRFTTDARFPTKGEIDMLFTFDFENCLEKWILTTDKSKKIGFSTASLVRTNSETAVFSGNLDTTVPKDGKTRRTGFASILTKRLLKSFKRFDTYDWSKYTHLVLKVRGDGRTYMIILGCPSEYDVSWQYQFHYPLYTRGGPYWQIAKIPFSNFYFVNGGKIEDRQCMMDEGCSRVGITLADGKSGPFKLEIEYFGLEYQSFHKAICPYEGYSLKKNVAA